MRNQPVASGLAAACLLLPASGRCGSWEIGYAFEAPTSRTNGLSWDGQYLWHSHDTEPVVFKLNPNGGAVVGQMPTSLPDQGDLEFGGGFLWVNSENDHFLHKIDIRTGKTVDSIYVLGIPPGEQDEDGDNYVQLEGCTFDGRNIWVDGGSNIIVRIDPVRRTQAMYVMPYEMGYLDGMTWAFDHLWVVTNNATIYELDPCTMGVLDRFDAPANVGAGPEGFAFDGENLWFADNELDKIYKIILKDKILTKRAAPRPARGAVAKAAGCNPGIPLKPPATGFASPGPLPGARPGRSFSATPLFARPGSAGRVDSRGRAARARPHAKEP